MWSQDFGLHWVHGSTPWPHALPHSFILTSNQSQRPGTHHITTMCHALGMHLIFAQHSHSHSSRSFKQISTCSQARNSASVRRFPPSFTNCPTDLLGATSAGAAPRLPPCASLACCAVRRRSMKAVAAHRKKYAGWQSLCRVHAHSQTLGSGFT